MSKEATSLIFIIIFYVIFRLSIYMAYPNNEPFQTGRDNTYEFLQAYTYLLKTFV